MASIAMGIIGASKQGAYIIPIRLWNALFWCTMMESTNSGIGVAQKGSL